MIVEIKHINKEVVILVEEITHIEFEEKTLFDTSNGLSRIQYEFSITLKDRNNMRFWFNGDKTECLIQYNKVKEAFVQLYKKDTVEQEIKKYLQNMSEK